MDLCFLLEVLQAHCLNVIRPVWEWEQEHMVLSEYRTMKSIPVGLVCVVSECWWKLCSPQVLACYWASIECYSQCQFDKFYENCTYIWIFSHTLESLSCYRLFCVSFLGVQIPKLLEPYCVYAVFPLFLHNFLHLCFCFVFCPKSVPSVHSYSQKTSFWNSVVLL